MGHKVKVTKEKAEAYREAAKKAKKAKKRKKK